MWRIFTPRRASNLSIARWSSEPIPVVPTVTAPGLASGVGRELGRFFTLVSLWTEKLQGSSMMLPM
jgi:hypothetical protein